MINTNCTDLVEVRRIGNEVKKEVSQYLIIVIFVPLSLIYFYHKIIHRILVHFYLYKSINFNYI